MNQLKIALFTGNYNHIRDGVSLTLNRLVRFLEENGVEVLVFGPTIDEPALDHAGTLVAVPSIKAPGRPEYRISTGFPKKLKKKLDGFDPDIVHIATPDLLGYKALKWGLKKKKTIVSSFHTHFASYLKYYGLGLIEPLGWKYMKWFYEHCTHVYVPTPSMADELKARDINTEFRIWARGVDAEAYNSTHRSAEWRKQHGIGADEIVVLFVSRLVWEKNLKLYADIVKTAAVENPRIKAVVVGDGPALDDMKKLLPEGVFTGFLQGQELSIAYASSDIFLFPSDTETFGNVTLEAMASGLPVIVADAPGGKSLVEEGENGFVADVEDPNKFLHYVNMLAEDDTLRRSMSEISRKLSLQYSREAINGQLLNDYREALVQNKEI